MERHILATCKIADGLIENVLFYVAKIGLRNRINQVDIRLIIFFEPFLTFFTVFRMQHHAVRAVAHLRFFAVELCRRQI